MSAPTENKPGTAAPAHAPEEAKAQPTLTTQAVSEALNFEFIEATRPRVNLASLTKLSCS